MELLSSLKFCQWAVARKNFEPALTHFKISGGRIQSFNGSISLSSPIDLSIECQPLAANFLKTIANCRDTVSMSVTPTGKLSIKSGKTRALIECTQETFPEIGPEGRELPIGGKFMEALDALEPLIAEDASRPWARGILFDGDRAYATNNVVLAEYDLHGGQFMTPINIPHAAVNELLRIKKIPSHMLLADNSVSFMYDDGRWLRTALGELKWPDLGSVLNRDHGPMLDIPADFWQSLDDLKIHVNESMEVFIVKNHLTTSLDPENASYAEVQGLPAGEPGCYHIEMLRILTGLAKRIDFSGYPAPCLWEGDSIRGAVIGRRYKKPGEV